MKIENAQIYIYQWLDDFDSRHAYSIVKIAETSLQLLMDWDLITEQTAENPLHAFREIKYFKEGTSIIRDILYVLPVAALLEEHSVKQARGGGFWRDLRNPTFTAKTLAVASPCIKIGIDALHTLNMFQHWKVIENLSLKNWIIISEKNISFGNIVSISNITIKCLGYGIMSSIAFYNGKNNWQRASAISTIVHCAISTMLEGKLTIYTKFTANILGYANMINSMGES